MYSIYKELFESIQMVYRLGKLTAGSQQLTIMMETTLGMNNHPSLTNDQMAKPQKAIMTAYFPYAVRCFKSDSPIIMFQGNKERQYFTLGEYKKNNILLISETWET